MRPVRAFLLAAAPLLLSACASVSRLAPSSGSARIVEVQNAHDSDVTVYLRRGNYEHPLGVVPSNGKATLLIPAHMIRANGSLLLIGDPKGVDRPFEMQPFRLEAQQFAKWEIHRDTRQSQLTVWAPTGASGASRVAIDAR